MIRSFTVVALMCMTSGESVRSEGNSKRSDAVQVRGHSTVRTAPTSKRCGFMEVWGDLGRRATGRNRQAVCSRP
jgi:hypothetical protein